MSSQINTSLKLSLPILYPFSFYLNTPILLLSFCSFLLVFSLYPSSITLSFTLGFDTYEAKNITFHIINVNVSLDVQELYQ